jgi:hypothetical protein
MYTIFSINYVRSIKYVHEVHRITVSHTLQTSIFYMHACEQIKFKWCLEKMKRKYKNPPIFKVCWSSWLSLQQEFNNICISTIYLILTSYIFTKSTLRCVIWTWTYRASHAQANPRFLTSNYFNQYMLCKHIY